MNESKTQSVINVPIVKVTVLEDRAIVVRKGVVSLKETSGSFRIKNVSPVISDTSLKASIEENTGSVTGLKICDCRVVRQLRVLNEDLEQKSRELVHQIEETDRTLVELVNEIALVRHESSLNSDLLNCTVREAADDVRWGQNVDSFLGSSVQELETELATAAAKDIELSQKKELLLEKRNDLFRNLQSLANPSTVREGSICFQIPVDSVESAVAKGLDKVAVEIEYMVPGACWRPVHEAALDTGLDKDNVSFETSAALWQNTGEDWEDVEILLSTERPSLGTTVPLLNDDCLSLRKKQEKTVELREEKIASFELDASDEKPSSLPKKKDPSIPGIDDGGVVKLLRPKNRISVTSDGRYVNVPLSSCKSTGEVDLLLFPEIHKGAFERVRLQNCLAEPVLAGPVNLIKDGAACGRTSTMYVAPDESFSLGFGISPAIRCHRSHYRHESEQKMLSRWVLIDYSVEIKISSLAMEDVDIVVEERIPVSEIEEVKIQFHGDKTSSGTTGPDKNGKIRWKVHLPPEGSKTIKLAYTIEKKADIHGL